MTSNVDRGLAAAAMGALAAWRIREAEFSEEEVGAQLDVLAAALGLTFGSQAEAEAFEADATAAAAEMSPAHGYTVDVWRNLINAALGHRPEGLH